MPSKRDLLQTSRQTQAKKADVKPRYRSVICAADGSRTVGSQWADEDAKVVWHQLFGSGGIGRAKCVTIANPELGLGVEVSKIDDRLAEWEVVSDDPFLRRSATDARNYGVTSPQDLLPGGRLMLWVDSRQITPLSTYDTAETLQVNVVSGDYPYLGTRKTFAGSTNQDLTSRVPGAGLTRLVGLYLDSANSLQFVDGGTVAIGLNPPEPTWPTGAFRLSVVRLDNAQTSLVFEDDIFDRRMIWSDEQGGTDNPETLTVKNTSGFTIAANIVGYIKYVAGSGMEFDLSTTTGQACVCVVGGANNATITVATRGRFTLSYSSTAPAAGEFLTIVSGFGTVIAQAYMSPTVMAVAMAAGAGGTVDVLLLCHTATVTYTSTNPIMQGPTLFSNSDFNGTIATLPGGAVLTYTVSSGDEKWLDQFSTSELSKLRLYNSTRLTHALISDTDVGTNTITLTANVPAGWVTTDVITIRSPLNTDTSGGAYFMEREFTAEVPELARAVIMDMQWFDTAANGQRLGVHPYEAFSASKQFYLDSSTAHILARTVVVPLIQRRFTFRADASGADTCLVNFYVMGYLVAAP